jgi:hypothetical protein
LDSWIGLHEIKTPPYYTVDGFYNTIGDLDNIEGYIIVEVHPYSNLCFGVSSNYNGCGENTFYVIITGFTVVDPEVLCSDSNACTYDYCSFETGFCAVDPVTCDDFSDCTEDTCDLKFLVFLLTYPPILLLYPYGYWSPVVAGN